MPQIPMFTDTHCHLAAPELRFRLPEIWHSAQQNGVRGLIVPSTHAGDWATVLAFRQPETLNATQSATQHQPYFNIRAMALGIHPWFVHTHQPNDLVQLNAYLAQDSHIWVGEIGLDFHPNRQPENTKHTQIQLFEAQLSLAKQHARPIILHNVKATQHIIQAIKRIKFQHGGIAHAFSGSLEESKLLIDLGFKIGLGSLLLNTQAKKVRHLAQHLPEHSILLETDSPYMQPENRNTPSNLAQIAAIVAQLRACSLTQLAQSCEKNLQDLLANRLQNGISPV